MAKITCIQHIECEGPGTLGEILRSKGVEIVTVQPAKGEPIPEHLGDGLVVLGGPMGAYEETQHPWLVAELAALEKALESRLPILGICLGSQLLAKAAGAQVFRGAQPEVGWHPIYLTPEGSKDPLLMGLPPEMTVFHWHGDTYTLPPKAERLAWSDLSRIQAYRVGSNAYGFQFHLEVTKDMARDWMQKYARELTYQGGVIQPERITNGLDANIGRMRAWADATFGRFAALL